MSKENISLIKQYINNDTGEILVEDSLEIKEPIFKFKNRGNRFTKTWQGEDLILSKGTYYKYFHYIERRLEMETNRIVIHGNSKKDNKAIDKNMLCDIVGASKSTINRFMSECIEKKYIALLEVNKTFFGYIVNPLYMMNGNHLNIFLYTLFCDNDNFKNHISKSDLSKVNNYLKLKCKVNQ